MTAHGHAVSFLHQFSELHREDKTGIGRLVWGRGRENRVWGRWDAGGPCADQPGKGDLADIGQIQNSVTILVGLPWTPWNYISNFAGAAPRSPIGMATA